MASLGTEEDSAVNTPLSFRVPDEFVELDLTEDPSSRLNRTFEELSRKLTDFDDVELLTVAMRQEYMIMQLIEEGAVYSGTCAAQADESVPRLAIVQLTVLVKEFDLSDGTTLATLASGLRSPGDPRDVGLVDLPAGQALMVAEQVAIDSSTDLAGRERRRTSLVRQVQATIPFPSKRKAAVFSISSESSAGWQEFLEIFGRILKTVSFKSSNEVTIKDRLAG